MAPHAPLPTMPKYHHHVTRTVLRQHGAILIESLIALAILSLGAAAMFRAFDNLRALSHAANQLGVDTRAQLGRTEAR